MKRVVIIISLLIILTGCAGSKACDFDRDSVQSISIWTYDLVGHQSMDNWFYEDKDTKVILDYLEGLRGKEVSQPTLPDDLEIAYGVNLMAGRDINYLFIGDYMVTNNGTYYEIDTEKAIDALTEILGDTRTFDGLYLMNHRYVSLVDSEWDSRYMSASVFDVLESDQIRWEAEYNAIGNRNELETTIINDSNKTIEFGEQNHIQVLLNGTWYDINMMTTLGTELAWNSILIMVESGQTYNSTLYLKHYQTLPIGTYRAVKAIDIGSESYHIACEFVVIAE